MGMSVVLLEFSHKAEYWGNYNFDLMMMLEEKSFIASYSVGNMNGCIKFKGNPSNSPGIAKIIRRHLGTMDVCTTFSANPYNSCQDILLQSKMPASLGAAEKVRGSLKSLGLILCGP